MKSKMLWTTSSCFLIGLCLIAFSYATFLQQAPIWSSFLRQLGLALIVASLISASVDFIFQKHLVEQTKKAAKEAAETLTDQIENLGHTISSIHKESKGVLERVPIMFCCLQSGISNIYQSRSDSSAEARMIELLMNAKRRVDIMGISLRTFFQGGGKVNIAVNEIMKNSAESDFKGAHWKVLVIDPVCEQAELRSEREELPGTLYKKGNLYREVNDTIEIVESRYIKTHAKIDIRAYRGVPSCFLLIVDDVMFVEQYHYGRERGQRAAELVPLIEFQSSSTMFLELEGHFNYMWESLSRNPYENSKKAEKDAPAED